MSASFPSDDAKNGAAVGGLAKAGPYNALRRFAQAPERKPTSAPAVVEHCDLCSEILPPDHRHMLDIAGRSIACACQACSLLFNNADGGKGKYRLIPERYLTLTDFHMTSEQWDELTIPVNMVYMFHSSLEKHVVAFYPSPAGAMESLLNLETWETLVQDNPILSGLIPDVEALLINRVRNTAQSHYYIVPIDTCFHLVGLIRTNWRGLSGGEEVWKAITEFFATLQKKSRPIAGDMKGEKGEANAGPEL